VFVQNYRVVINRVTRTRDTPKGIRTESVKKDVIELNKGDGP